MKNRKFLFVIGGIIIILIIVLIVFSEKRKDEFELVKSEASEVMKLINQAGEFSEKAERGEVADLWAGVHFNMNKVVLFADQNKNKIFDDPAILEYKLSENIVFNLERNLFFLPNYDLVYFCEPDGLCEKENYHVQKIQDINTGRAMEFRIEHKTGRIELREVVDLF